MESERAPVETFGYRDAASRLKLLLETEELEGDVERQRFLSRREVDGRAAVEFHPPRVLPILPAARDPEQYLRALEDPPRLGRQVLVLVQAGASALGYWQEQELLHHKALRTYVVRGKGRAQPTHLKTKGKSRYGSRLRLRNFERQLVHTNEKLVEWWEEEGPADVVHLACPVRIRPELFAVEPPPPFPSERTIDVPFHVHRPDHEELLRIRRLLTRGRIERR